MSAAQRARQRTWPRPALRACASGIGRPPAPRMGLDAGLGAGPAWRARSRMPASVPYGGGAAHEDEHGRRAMWAASCCGVLGGKCVLAMQGRLHGYEGNTAQEVAYPVWLMQRAGRAHAVSPRTRPGRINEGYARGRLLPHRGPHQLHRAQPRRRASSPTSIVVPLLLHAGRLRPRAAPPWRATTADELRHPRAGGRVPGRVLGPSFETPAEIRAFRAWGADTVAMSVCEEVIAARHVGMRVLGMSLVSEHGLRHRGRLAPRDEEVLDVARDARGRLRAPGHRHRRAAVVGGGAAAKEAAVKGAPARAAAHAPSLAPTPPVEVAVGDEAGAGA